MDKKFLPAMTALLVAMFAFALPAQAVNCTPIDAKCDVWVATVQPPATQIPGPPSCPSPQAFPGAITVSALKLAPAYPLVIGQDDTKRGADARWEIVIQPTVYVTWKAVPEYDRECGATGGMPANCTRSNGLRVSELANLKLGDLLLTERKSTLTVRAGKGTKQRTLPLNKDARQVLEQWLAVRPPIAADMLFAGQRGEPMRPRSAQIAVSRLARLAGLPDVTPHTLRHTFAKSLVDNGVTLEKVATLLGHESLDTTRLYVTPGERDLEEAVERLAE